MLSVIIPARNERFLSNTVSDVLAKARGEIEVIVVLDGYWPAPPLVADNRLRILHRGAARGMRAGINGGVAIARGEFVMKLDAHCMVDEGFDLTLAAECGGDWVVIPRRKRLDAENWRVQAVDKPDVDYEYLSYPDDPADFGGRGLNGKIWPQRALERRHIPVDDNMSFQGSCWFMRREYFAALELMDEGSYGPFWSEAQEIGLKAWLSGGRVVTNKRVWYAHLHKGKKHGRGYQLPESWLRQGAAFTRSWMGPVGTAWPRQTKPLADLVERFWPVPGWPEDRALWRSPA